MAILDPEIYIDINSDLSEDIGEKLEKAINSTNDPETAVYIVRKSIRIFILRFKKL